MGLVSTIYGNNTYSGKAIKSQKRKTKKRIRKVIMETYQHELRDRATNAEIAFQHILIDMRIQYEFQKVFGRKNGKFRIVDFWLPQLRTVVEIDGGYHDNPIQQWKDTSRTMQLIKHHRGQIKKVIRFTNEEVLNNPETIKKRICL